VLAELVDDLLVTLVDLLISCLISTSLSAVNARIPGCHQSQDISTNSYLDPQPVNVNLVPEKKSFVRALMNPAVVETALAETAPRMAPIAGDYDCNILSRKVKSEMSLHAKMIRNARCGMSQYSEGTWISHSPVESLESFLQRCPPSKSQVAWIDACHQGRSALVSAYYRSSGVAAATPASLAAQWRRERCKSPEALRNILRAGGCGCGKWMVFVPNQDVDSTWGRIVTALWDGLLGHSAKVSDLAYQDRACGGATAPRPGAT
jgi:hypothetical protein